MSAHRIEVLHRHLCWQVAVNGLTRPRIDWFCTKERAIEHALDLARDAGISHVELLDWGGGIAQTVAVDARASAA